VGAGAAGLMAASEAARRGAKVLLIEKMERAGRKLLITGKGRCNITNDAPMSDFFKHIYPTPRFLKPAFSGFFSSDIISILNEYGVETVVERGGRVFPASNLSADVVAALVKRASSAKVEIRYRTKALEILSSDGKVTGLKVESEGKQEIVYTENVIITTGGASYPATGSNGDGYRLAKELGHTLAPVRPALVSLLTEGPLAADLQGLSLKNVSAAVWVNSKKQKEEFGEMLFTHFGLSGPIILTLSRLVVDEMEKGHKVEITIDLKPALDEQKLDTRLLRDLNEHGKKHIDNMFKEWLPSKMIPVFFQQTGIDPNKECHQINAKERRKILSLMKTLRFLVVGNRSFKEAIITAGGVNVSEIDSHTMESKKVKGLYFAGEILDLDADTGGFNLQIAWSTGWLAGVSCVKTEE
jgi:predicted Rossmann fold flavoprotein